MQQLSKTGKSAPRAPVAPAQQGGKRNNGIALPAQGIDAQQAALRPGSAPGFEAQRAALSPGLGNGGASDVDARATLAATATAAVHEVAAEQQGSKPAPTAAEKKRNWQFRIGEKIGMALGVAVTRVLAYVPSWNEILRDEQGQELQQVEGAERVGAMPLRKRHMQVVGPQISAWVAGLSPGKIRDFLEGVGVGATAAPGETYRREVAEAGN